MKKLIVFLFLVIASIACSKKKSSDNELEIQPVEKTSCPANGKYARSVSEAAKGIIGTWKLVSSEYGWVPNYTPDEQRLTFKADGSCTVVTKDSTYAPVNYSMQTLDKVGYSPLNYPSAPVPVLSAGDTIQAGRDIKYYRVGKSILILCQDELHLDYGLGKYADAPVLTYRREVE